MNKALLLLALLSATCLCFGAEKVQIQENQLVVDGVSQPQLFGAEIQYFRLRGGQGKNIPRARVMEIWNRALDHAVEAGMNTVSFYIPWDFHEYKEGHFDFTGTVDEDGDGLPDYPSRDVVTFIKLIEQKGINLIMARPGPYINAEWGFLGFGAIPLWFHEKYPDSHMQNSEGLRTKLYDYHSPDLLRHTRLWFEAVYNQVLKNHIGGDGPIVFMQLDNETNYMWQSIYNHDYGPRALARYREFMGRDVNPPRVPGLDVAADRSWYQFQDYSIYTYLKKLRLMWEEIGVKEPQIIFTLAESYNAMKNGLLPNFKQRNAPGQTGMISLNLYPKTYELPSSPLMNLPFKADHDVKAMDAAGNYYLGSKQEWLMGPEIQGGWWRSTPVSSESRRQTYLSTLGHGLKAIYIYYFTEGDNWQAGWIKEQVTPFYQELRLSAEFAKYSEDLLPHEFWQRLQRIIDTKVIIGIDAYRIMRDEEASSPDLYFDAPLDHEAKPKKHFAELKNFGINVIAPYQDFLARSIRVTDPVVIMKDLATHAPSPIPGIDSVLMNAEWAGGLMGYLAQVGISADIHHWDLNQKEELLEAKMIFYQDSGIASQAMVDFYEEYITKGGTVVTLLGDTLARKLSLPLTSNRLYSTVPIKVQTATEEEFDAAPSPLHTYTATKGCTPILWASKEAIAMSCPIGKGHFIQIGALFYDIFNSDWYGLITDSKARINFLRTILNVTPTVEIRGDDQVTAFARKDKGTLWLTVKSGRLTEAQVTLKISKELLKEVFGDSKKFDLKRIMGGKTQKLTLPSNIVVNLKPQGSEVFVLQAAHE